jgi:hypothetical protein
MLLEEVRGEVAHAASAGRTLQIRPHAKRLLAAFEDIGSQRRIADELIIEAAQAGVPVEIDRCY